jgi:hypothetical protein
MKRHQVFSPEDLDLMGKNVLPTDKGEAMTAILATQCILEASSQRILVSEMVDDGPSIEIVIKNAMLQLFEPGGPRGSRFRRR